ncbi:outer membrane beta-barrel protein [Granulosicoccaceae sp. 1_MG-2023]|nr:outer membrane beta-barrel protein [Granulosicoccaceae sp. 1_MG-2023]
MKTRLLALAVLLSTAAPVSAGSVDYIGYIGIDGALMSLEEPIGETIEPANLRLRLGGRIAPRLDIEGHFTFTVDSDEKYGAQWSTNVAAGFLKGYLPLGRYTSLYGLAGFSNITVVESVGRDDFYDDDIWGFAYGVGIETVLSERVDLSLDWVQYLHDDEIYDGLSALAFGFKVYY